MIPGPWKLLGRVIVAAAITFSGTATSARSATASFNPTADTTLMESAPNNNFGDGTSFQAGGRRQGGRTRGLFGFDLSSVPAGSSISSVTLTLNMTATPHDGGVNSVFDLHRLNDSWGEGNGSDHGGSAAGAGQSTWNNRLGSGTPWTTPGGDFAAGVSASRSMTGSGSYTFSSTVGLVSDVQGW